MPRIVLHDDVQAIHDVAREDPARMAIRQGGASCSYEQLWAAAERAARSQREAGLRDGERVLHAGDHGAALTWLLACALAGTVLVPVATGSPEWAQQVARRTGARAAVAASGELELIAEPATPPPAPQDLRAIVMTSGSTGASKAVWIDDRMADAACGAAAATLGLGPDTVFLDLLPAHTVGHLFLVGLPVLAAGGTLAVERFFPTALPEQLGRQRPTATILLPIMLRMLHVSGTLARCDLSGLRTLGCGASIVSGDLPGLVLRAGARRFVHLYGLTEALTPILARATSDPDDPQATLLNGPCGDTEVRLSRGGELLLRGSAITRGYDGDPAQTSAALCDGWFATGDLFARRGDGWEFGGRLDELIKVNGYSVAPALTEAVVAELEGVRACAVGVAPHPSGGELLVCLVEGSGISSREVIAACRARVDAHQVPRRVVEVERVPVNAMGKVQRPAATALIAEWAHAV